MYLKKSITAVIAPRAFRIGTPTNNYYYYCHFPDILHIFFLSTFIKGHTSVRNTINQIV